MFRPLDRVRLLDGPYAGRLGIVMQVSSKGTVTVAVEEDGSYCRRLVCKSELLAPTRRVVAPVRPTGVKKIKTSAGLAIDEARAKRSE